MRLAFPALLLFLVSRAKGSQIVLNDVADGFKQIDYESLKDYPGFNLDLAAKRLVLLNDTGPAVEMSELDKIKLRATGVKFFDITETSDLGQYPHRELAAFSYPNPSQGEHVKSAIKILSISRMQEFLKAFTSFRTRYYRSETGKKSQEWLLSRILEVTTKSASESLQKRISINEFPHSWGQSTIIVKINGTASEDKGIVIVSAHQDSTNMWPFLPAPGADDDGSGTTSIFEAYRALITIGFIPEHTVEFHFYSAEEGGLLGSQAVARDYESRGVNVIAMSQFDMTAWVKKGTKEIVGVITDYTDPALTEFNKQLIDAYLDIPYAETRCGYACSDHASWRKAGYPSIFTIESLFENSNPNIHSTRDQIDISSEFSFEHMLEFSKLAIAFAIELGHWTEA